MSITISSPSEQVWAGHQGGTQVCKIWRLLPAQTPVVPEC